MLAITLAMSVFVSEVIGLLLLCSALAQLTKADAPPAASRNPVEELQTRLRSLELETEDVIRKLQALDENPFEKMYNYVLYNFSCEILFKVDSLGIKSAKDSTSYIGLRLYTSAHSVDRFPSYFHWPHVSCGFEVDAIEKVIRQIVAASVPTKVAMPLSLTRRNRWSFGIDSQSDLCQILYRFCGAIQEATGCEH